VIIAVDFDGTCVEHCYPEIGDDVPGAVDWLRRFAAEGAKLILWTMRSDGPVQDDPNRSVLLEATEWFAERHIPLWGYNENPQQKSWTGSPKAYANIYVDDAAACCPLCENPREGGRPYVDWSVVGPAVLQVILDDPHKAA
jgi:hypothetical protein